eukprot:937814-Amphidinium_carterae.1
MRTFNVNTNGFSGCLPEGGLEVMLAMSAMYLARNRLAGALPEDSFMALIALEVLRIDHNDFEGQMPTPNMECFYHHGYCFRVACLLYVNRLENKITESRHGIYFAA